MLVNGKMKLVKILNNSTLQNKNFVFTFLFLVTVWALLSNRSGVPQAVTRSPAENANNGCATCHNVAGTFKPTITLDVLNTDSVKVTKYTPGETYILRVKMADPNQAKSFGFQLSCLDTLNKKDMGLWSAFAPNSKQQQLNVKGVQRKYIVQSAPNASGNFTLNWKAPSTNVGPIGFYFSGLAVNLTGNTNGDNAVNGNLILEGPASSSTENEINNKVDVYPNPSSNVIHVSQTEVKHATFYNLSGQSFNYEISDGSASIQDLQNGVYLLVLKDTSNRVLSTQKFIKF